jgi:hypothetical protein
MTARSLPFATAAAPMIGCNQRQREGGDLVTAKWGGPRVQVSSLIGRETPARRLSPATLSSRSLMPPIPVMDRHPANKAPHPVHKLIEYLRPIAIGSQQRGKRGAIAVCKFSCRFVCNRPTLFLFAASNCAVLTLHRLSHRPASVLRPRHKKRRLQPTRCIIDAQPRAAQLRAKRRERFSAAQS